MRIVETVLFAARALASLGAAMVAAALLFSFLAPLLPLADSVAHFRLQLLGALGVAAAALLALGRRPAALGAAALIALVAAMGLRPAWPVWTNAAQAEHTPTLTLLTLNLLFRNDDHAAVLALIKREAPDFIALQEVSGANQPLLAALRRDYPHQSVCPFTAVGAVAVLSRYPQAASLSTVGGVRGCVLGRGLAWMRVATPQGPITVASLHLHWPYPFGQAAQVEELAASLRSVPRPILLGGDFNAAPWSAAAARIAEAADAPVLGGLRFTFHFSREGALLPIGMPIDHVLADPSFAPVSIAVSDPVGSDHRAVTVRLLGPSETRADRIDDSAE